MPHLGVLSVHHYEAAREVFERDCIVRIGTCIAPIGSGKDGEPCVRVIGDGFDETVPFGVIRVLPYKGDGDVTIEPSRNFDVGAGKGKPLVAKSFDKNRGNRDKTTNMVEGGVGLIVDARGRPFNVEFNAPGRVGKLRSYLEALGLPLP
jgi:hypothetical protein